MRRSIPARWLLAGVVIVFLALALIYAAIIPVFEGFDAQAHYKAITYFRAERQLPILSPETVQRSYELVPHPPLYYVISALAATGWPIDEALDVARASINPYFDKSLSRRQSIVLPSAPWVALAPAWLARIVALAGGLLTIFCTWWLARLIVPATPTFALAAAAVATFNPQFLFTAVTISNDAWAAGMSALVLAMGADAVLRARTPRAWLWVGAAMGVAALTKYSTLFVGVPTAILYLLYLRQHGWRQGATALGLAALGFAGVAGWWFVRNWLLYGELVPLNRMAEILPTMRRPQPFDLARTLEYVPWLIASFWGVFVGVIAPPLYLDVTHWFMGLGLVGIAVAALRLRRNPPRAQVVLFAVLLPWLMVVALIVLHWTRTIEYGEQGRLAHIGASAFGVVMVAGWQAFAPERWRPVVHWAITGFMVAIAVLLVPFLQESFGVPAALAGTPAPDRPLNVRFDGGIRLLGVDLPAGAALAPGQALPLTLYFTTDQPIPDDYTLFLHLADDQDRMLYQFDGVPGEGHHPTRQWVPGQVFTDQHMIRVDEIPADSVATLSLGFYPIADPSARQIAYDGQDQPLGDRLVLAKLRLHPAAAQPAPAPAAPLASWQNGIVLDKAAVRTDATGLPAGVTFTWTPTRTQQQDYTVFIQILDAGNAILAQVDRQPQEGLYPTSTWRAGDVITDTVDWSGDVSRWERIIVGLYGEDGQRLGVTLPPGALDAVEITRRSP